MLHKAESTFDVGLLRHTCKLIYKESGRRLLSDLENSYGVLRF